MKVAVVDHGLCNIDSMMRALEYLEVEPVRTTEPSGLAGASRIVMPGVGAFPRAMARLDERGLTSALHDAVLDRHTPVLGVCLGMQLMMTTGEEVEETKGLGWFEGSVTRLVPEAGERVPHVGWNVVDRAADSAMFANEEPGRDYYFVHSFHVVPTDASVIEGRTPFCGGFVSAIRRDHLWGVQFHPEKSQSPGFNLLRAFLAQSHEG